MKHQTPKIFDLPAALEPRQDSLAQTDDIQALKRKIGRLRGRMKRLKGRVDGLSAWHSRLFLEVLRSVLLFLLR